jgi:hypothetical protein
VVVDKALPALQQIVVVLEHYLMVGHTLAMAAVMAVKAVMLNKQAAVRVAILEMVVAVLIVVGAIQLMVLAAAVLGAEHMLLDQVLEFLGKAVTV